jgi:hypothetical protein
LDRFPPEGDLVELRTLDEAVALLNEWITAYRRLEHEHSKALFAVEHARAAIQFDAVPMPQMQEEGLPF